MLIGASMFFYALLLELSRLAGIFSGRIRLLFTPWRTAFCGAGHFAGLT